MGKDNTTLVIELFYSHFLNITMELDILKLIFFMCIKGIQSVLRFFFSGGKFNYKCRHELFLELFLSSIHI